MKARDLRPTVQALNASRANERTDLDHSAGASEQMCPFDQWDKEDSILNGKGPDREGQADEPSSSEPGLSRWAQYSIETSDMKRRDETDKDLDDQVKSHAHYTLSPILYHMKMAF
jgi:ribosome modulation factor